MLIKKANFDDILEHALVSEGGNPLGGGIAHIGYGAGIIKLHNALKNRYKKKVLDELNKTIFRDSDKLKKLLV